MASSQPTNLNALYRNKFRLSFVKFPLMSFYCQSASLPAISVPSVVVKTPLNPVPTPGTVMEFSSLVATIIVDEYLDNYYEIYNWLVGLSSPEDVTQYPDWLNAQSAINGQSKPENLDYSDGLLEILNGYENVVRRVRFISAFPVSLSELTLSTTDAATEPVTFSTTFEYLDFEIEARKEDVSPV